MSGTNHGSALIVGAGPELGPALARHCIAAGMEVALAAREGARVAALVDELGARPCSCDVAVAEDVARRFCEVVAAQGSIDAVRPISSPP